MPETETTEPTSDELAVEESAQESTLAPEPPTVAEAPGGPVDAPPAPKAQGPVLKSAGAWADEQRVADWRFNAANLVERWLATPRTVITRRRPLEPGRDLTREQFEQGLARVDSVSCR
jgi:hypothetical protein